jgi:hypothetical protein
LGANLWMGVIPAPMDRAGGGEIRKRTRLTDPPTILGSAARKPKTTHAAPVRGILKNASGGASSTRYTSASSNVNHDPRTMRVDPRTFTFDEEDSPPPFVLDELMIEGDQTGAFKSGGTYDGPEIVVDLSRRQSYTSPASPTYEMWSHPGTSAADATPRAAINVARPTQKFEGMENGKTKGKGKARFTN